MAYVVRFSEDINWDIERGFSCWGDKSIRKTDLDIVQEIGGFWDDDELDAKQQRWINQFSDSYEDRDLFIETLARELADDSLIRDEKYGTWAEKHHDGLSCFVVEGNTPEAAIEFFRAAMADGHTFDPMLGSYTVGSVTLVQSFKVDEMTESFHLLECDAVEEEEMMW